MEYQSRRVRPPISAQAPTFVWLVAITVATVVGAYAVLKFTTLPLIIAIAVPVIVGVLLVRQVGGTQAQRPGGY